MRTKDMHCPKGIKNAQAKMKCDVHHPFSANCYYALAYSQQHGTRAAGRQPTVMHAWVMLQNAKMKVPTGTSGSETNVRDPNGSALPRTTR
jgi:hypothetical protein